MKKVFYLFLVLSILFFASTTSARIIFYDNCENAPNLTNDWSLHAEGNPITASDDYAYAGDKAFKFPRGSGTQRCELNLRVLNETIQPVRNFEYNKSYWIGYAILFSGNPVYAGLATQFHLSQDTCDITGQGPVVGMYIAPGASGDLQVSLGGSEVACQTSSSQFHRKSDALSYAQLPNYLIGQWNRVVINVQFSYDGTRYFRLWLNGDGPYESTWWNCSNDTKGPFLKIGRYVGDPQPAGITVYYDEIRIGDENSSYAEVSPSGASNQPPSVAISPSTTQNVSLHGSFDPSCTASDVDGTISSMSITYDDSGIATDNSTPGTTPATLDPSAKTMDIEGVFNVICSATDNDGDNSYSQVTVIVGGGGITGITNEWELESGAITTDDQGNENLVNHGSIASESSGTEPDPPGYGTWGVELNGTDQYFSVDNWDLDNPWQTGQSAGSFAICLETPSSYLTSLKYLGGSYDPTQENRLIAWILDDAETYMQPRMNIGVNGGASYESKQFGTGLPLSTKLTIIYTADAKAKTWSIDVFNHATSEWLNDADGSITGTVNLSGDAPWVFGCRSDGLASTFVNFKIYWMRVYNTVLTDGEKSELVEGEYEEPPAGLSIESWCYSKYGEGCLSDDYTFKRNEQMCITLIFTGNSTYTADGSYSNIELPLTLNKGGSMTLRYAGGEKTNQWQICDIVGITDQHTGDLDLSSVNDLVLDALGGAGVTIRAQDGSQVPKTLPSTESDHNIDVDGVSNVVWIN